MNTTARFFLNTWNKCLYSASSPFVLCRSDTRKLFFLFIFFLQENKSDKLHLYWRKNVRSGYERRSVRREHCIERMLLHKWTMQDKDFDIIIIKSEQHHMVRERSCAKTIKLKASQWAENTWNAHFSARRTDKVWTYTFSITFSSPLLSLSRMWVDAWSVPWAC